MNAEEFTANAGDCVIPEFLLERRKDESDPETDLTNVYVVGILATNKDPNITPIPFPYTAFWGELTMFGYALVTDPIP